MVKRDGDVRLLNSFCVPKPNRARGVGSTVLAISMASARVSKGMMEKTGPKDSSLTMLSSVESTRTAVGEMKRSDWSVGSPPSTTLPLVSSTIFLIRRKCLSLTTRA